MSDPHRRAPCAPAALHPGAAILLLLLSSGVAAVDRAQEEITIEALVAPSISVRTSTPRMRLDSNQSPLQATLDFHIESNRPTVAVQISATDLQAEPDGASRHRIPLDRLFGVRVAQPGAFGSAPYVKRLPFSLPIAASETAAPGYATATHPIDSPQQRLVFDQQLLLTLRWLTPPLLQPAGRYQSIVILEAYSY